ncbi:hypothetical protein SAMN06265365_12917 [Tistlia consotensis]|uniref:Uncharacterized protein n=1 Tax=Tistlia consotensis USBA 355 TaxID=560819 RepID=A0A1Y6CLY7_9PROT|nr:hypothetical protein [Tistlia consotensis]SMF75600.1 hypothetical protein SAMN05428998_13449 [Tistlia consotensis USBA 355]SNS07691.1 hypothetical protein SAMN06265365_12917 [Tistlia consotensis]
MREIIEEILQLISGIQEVFLHLPMTEATGQFADAGQELTDFAILLETWLQEETPSEETVTRIEDQASRVVLPLTSAFATWNARVLKMGPLSLAKVIDARAAKENLALLQPFRDLLVSLIAAARVARSAFGRESGSGGGGVEPGSGLFARMSDVRISVADAPNLGHQSAVLALIANLRRLGFAAPPSGVNIEVAVSDADPSGFDQRITVTQLFTMPLAVEHPEVAIRQAVDAALEAFCTDADYYVLGEITGLQDHDAAGKPYQTADLAGGSVPDALPSGFTATTAAEMLAAFRQNFEAPEGMALLGTAVDIAGLPVEDNGDDQQGTVDPSRIVMGNKGFLLTVAFRWSRQAAGQSSLDKIARLDPRYDRIPGVRWLVGSDRFPDEASDTTLGLIAASDAASASSPETVSTLRTAYLRTEGLLVLQPFLWHPHHRFVSTARNGEAQFAGQKIGDPLPPQPPACWLYDPATYFVEPVESGPAFDLYGGYVRGADPVDLAKILTSVGARKTSLMTAYGLHQTRDDQVALVLGNLLRALLAAQATFDLKPAVLFAVYGVRSLGALVPEGLADDCGFLDLSAPSADLGTALAALEAAETPKVLLVQSPGLPGPIFQCFVQASTFPVILEGANTTNLCQMLGKPYLSVNTTATPYVTIDDQVQANFGFDPALNVEACLAAVGLLSTATSDYLYDADGATAAHLAAVLALPPAVMTYFLALQRLVRHPEMDQVRIGLEVLLARL